MSVFLIKSDLPIQTQKKIDAIEAIPAANRTSTQSAFLTALLPYLTNLIISVGEDGLINCASGLTVPTGAAGFRKGATFIKTDASANGQYMNVGSTTSAFWDLVDQASTANIDDGAVTLAKMANMATASLIYRKTAAAGVPEVQSLATLKTDLGLAGSNSGDQTILLTGNVTGTGTGTFAATLATLPTGTPVNGIAAVGTLTLTGTVLDGETFTVGGENFEIDTDGVYSGKQIDVSSFAVAAKGTLTVTGGGNQIADAYSILIGSKTYTFKTTLTSTEGEVLIGANDTAALLNLKNALNHGGTPGTDYFCAAANPNVLGFSSAALTLVIQARVPGTVANSIVLTKSGAEISWDGTGTLGGTTLGSDCTAANADGQMVSDFNSKKALTTVVASQGAGTTVLFTNPVKGVIGNNVGFIESLSHGSMDGSTKLGGTTAGVDGTIGVQWQPMVDATNLYVCTATNTIHDANWKKLVFSSM